jgi:hypothetical protein
VLLIGENELTQQKNILAWCANDNVSEYWTEFRAEEDDQKITTAALFGCEFVRESSRRWPAFGEAEEELMLVFENKTIYDRYCKMFNMTPWELVY